MPEDQANEAAEDTTFAGAVARAAAPADDPWVSAAHRLFHDEGVIEVDQPAVLSGPEDGSGTYVMAWVWVSRDDLSDEELQALEKIEASCETAGGASPQ